MTKEDDLLYTDEDLKRAGAAVHREAVRCVLATLPVFLCAIAALYVRMRLLCTFFAILTSFLAIFFVDNRLIPTIRYRLWLREALSGLSHETAGLLMRVGTEDVWEEGVCLRELILNIYADGSADGERRFLLDAAKPLPDGLQGRVVIVKSHDTSVLGVVLRKEEAGS